MLRRIKNNLYAWIFVGGALGAMARAGLGEVLPLYASWFPTLLINIAGAFVIGVLFGIEQRLHPNLKSFYIVGFCGGFTTFSTFSHQTIGEFQNGMFLYAASNIILSLLFTLPAVWFGTKLGTHYHNSRPPNLP